MGEPVFYPVYFAEQFSMVQSVLEKSCTVVGMTRRSGQRSSIHTQDWLKLRLFCLQKRSKKLVNLERTIYHTTLLSM